VNAAVGIRFLILIRRQVMNSLVNLYPFTDSGTADAICPVLKKVDGIIGASPNNAIN
jgi:hypothetical protein